MEKKNKNTKTHQNPLKTIKAILVQAVITRSTCVAICLVVLGDAWDNLKRKSLPNQSLIVMKN